MLILAYSLHCVRVAYTRTCRPHFTATYRQFYKTLALPSTFPVAVSVLFVVELGVLHVCGGQLLCVIICIFHCQFVLTESNHVG